MIDIDRRAVIVEEILSTGRAWTVQGHAVLGKELDLQVLADVHLHVFARRGGKGRRAAQLGNEKVQGLKDQGAHRHAHGLEGGQEIPDARGLGKRGQGFRVVEGYDPLAGGFRRHGGFDMVPIGPRVDLDGCGRLGRDPGCQQRGKRQDHRKEPVTPS
ncbi:MAG TPA: hypothetical protein VM681_03710 [Candidatus Thermoplasmatota archaeon]|nr:hypothetical protein [Candidatus Thermoplasmatota archaeon]